MGLFSRSIFLLLAVSLCIGCSDSVSSTNYPLQLTAVSDTIVNNSALFNFRITKNGAPVKGARLQRTDSPILTTFDLGIASDSAGNFPRVIIVIPLTQDTMTAVAYQAVSDTLLSNYFRWP
jgi:hypothetical protein